MSDDPFRWCIHCNADCYADEPEHAATCPSSTGIDEVRYESCHPPCEHCGKRPDPSMRCSECDCSLELGDHYTHRKVGEAFQIPVYEVVCLGCAAHAEIA